MGTYYTARFYYVRTWRESGRREEEEEERRGTASFAKINRKKRA